MILLIKDINNKCYQHCYSLAKIDNALLRKYDINMNREDFVYYAKSGRFPFDTIITGNRYNVRQQRHTNIYNLNLISSLMR